MRLFCAMMCMLVMLNTIGVSHAAGTAAPPPASTAAPAPSPAPAPILSGNLTHCPATQISASAMESFKVYITAAQNLKLPCLTRLDVAPPTTTLEFIPDNQTTSTWTSKLSVTIVTTPKDLSANTAVEDYAAQVIASFAKSGYTYEKITTANTGPHGKIVAFRYVSPSKKTGRLAVVRTVAKDRLATFQLIGKDGALEKSQEKAFLAANGLR